MLLRYMEGRRSDERSRGLIGGDGRGGTKDEEKMGREEKPLSALPPSLPRASHFLYARQSHARPR